MSAEINSAPTPPTEQDEVKPIEKCVEATKEPGKIEEKTTNGNMGEKMETDETHVANGTNGVDVSEKKPESEPVEDKPVENEESDAEPEKVEEKDQEKDQKDQDKPAEEPAAPKKGGRKSQTTKNEDAKPDEPVSELAASVRSRNRKQVERFVNQGPVSEDRTPAFHIPEGTGIKFNDLDNVEYKLSRTDVDDLKPLHRVLFGTAGKATVVRKNLRQFNGFDFDKESPQFAKKLESIQRFTVKGLKFVLQLLDLEQKGDREELESRLMDFLMKPQPSGRKSLKEQAKEEKERKKKIADKKKASKDKKVALKAKKAAKAEKAKAKKSPKKAGSKRPAPSSDVDSSGSEAGSDSESDSESEEESGEESPAPPKTPSPSPVKKAKATTPKKAATPAKSPAKSPAKKAAKKPKKESSEPTDDELHGVISDFVKDADLETVTMKNVIAHVFAKYPDQDLSGRKPWIKETVKQLVAAAP